MSLRDLAPIVLVAGLVVLASPAAAESVYGCAGLDGRTSLPGLEGEGGVFYRINPDLRMFQPLSEETMADMADLARALEGSGTTLIYAPLPTKSLAMPDQLPPEAQDLGFDVGIATTMHARMLERLAARGVRTADLRHALRAGAGEEPSMFATDYRLTSAGARRAASAIAGALSAAPGFDALPKGQFRTVSAGTLTLPSDMRSALQRHCMTRLPEVTTEVFSLTRTDRAALGAAAGAVQVVLVGTEHSGEAAVNLAGFVSEATGLQVAHHSVTGGGAFAAISSYLTSQAFRDAPPAYLVWINPVDQNPARPGDQPMRELIAAAGDTCRADVPLTPAARPDTVTADLTGLPRDRRVTLLLAADWIPATAARFDFMSADGLIRSRSITRHPGQVRTGRFYMPMTGLWPEGVARVQIVLDVPFGATTRLIACHD